MPFTSLEQMLNRTDEARELKAVFDLGIFKLLFSDQLKNTLWEEPDDPLSSGTIFLLPESCLERFLSAWILVTRSLRFQSTDFILEEYFHERRNSEAFSFAALAPSFPVSRPLG